ncbi:hypothetical protein [Streptomyces sp. TLI_185]|uniref:hypothetical protein n=1 Tax=Streptomyces sp. TLI_185 TaxID=2485151 RepID=UPI000FAF28EA|nr:hypothetical protein [Streptomyces sp. TLI_185]RPF35120.1 hypothetical protein EDD92_5117 [Streptomyces sp. TLI_185]
MRSMLATLIGVLSATALVLGVGAALGPSADTAHSAHHIVADNQGPTVITP